MKTKDQVLNLLKDNANSYISGQYIAKTLFLTRASVWKAIKALRESGYNIEAVNNRGYCLMIDGEEFSTSSIESFLNIDHPIKIIALDEVESTNDQARKLALEGFEDDILIASDYQIKGRGRRGREFYSPKGTGLYMSLLIHPKMELSQATRITCMAAVSVCLAIKEITGIETQIKWVNDIFLNDKKIAGILTEGFTSMEDGSLSHVIVGIGINIYPPKEGFPKELKKIAGALMTSAAEADIKTRLCAAITRHFFNIYNDGSDMFVSEYKKRSNLIGHYVKIMQTGVKNSDNTYAKVLGIDDECHLMVEYENGQTDSLSTGEVSVVKY